jgi:hypothetical protein
MQYHKNVSIQSVQRFCEMLYAMFYSQKQMKSSLVDIAHDIASILATDYAGKDDVVDKALIEDYIRSCERAIYPEDVDFFVQITRRMLRHTHDKHLLLLPEHTRAHNRASSTTFFRQTITSSIVPSTHDPFSFKKD